MILKQCNGVSWLQFPGLLSARGVWHAIFLRMGGISPAPFTSLNVSAGNGDETSHVNENRRRIADLLPSGRLHTVRQTHGTQVVHISKIKGQDDQEPLCGDAMITRSKEQFLMIQVADCQAVLLIDPVAAVAANVHSGWRGSIENIVGNTVLTMVDQYQCRPERILAGVGPSLGPCCAEFKNYTTEIPRKFWSYKDSRDHFNFWALTRDQLASFGVARRHVHLSHICTRCNPHLFFSYRAKRQTGRFAAVIGLV